MPKLRTLTVSKRFESVRTPSGIYRPRVFEAGSRDFTDFKAQLSEGRRLTPHLGLQIARAVRHEYECISVRADQVWTRAYEKACRELQGTPAGKRAREALLEALTPYQQRDAEHLGYFDFWIYDRQDIDWFLERNKPPIFGPIMFRIDRRFPNGNISLGTPEDGWRWRICLHPLTPYPLDDICLAQMMTALMSPDEFIKAANITDRRSGKMVKVNRMFEPPAPQDLLLPFLKDPQDLPLPFLEGLR